MDTISLLQGEDFDSSIFPKIKNSKIFVFDYSALKTMKKLGFEVFLADELLDKTEREKIYDHVVSKLYWYEDDLLANISKEEKKVFQFLDPLYLHQKLLVTIIQFSILKKILLEEKPTKIFATENLSKIASSINNEIPITLLNSENLKIFDTFDYRFTFLSKTFSLKISMTKLRKLQNFYERFVGQFNNFWLVKTKKPLILLLEFDPSKFPHLFKKLKSNDYHCVVLNRRKSPLINKNSMEILKKSDVKIINFDKLLSNEQKNEIKIKTEKYRNFLNNFWENENSLNKIFSFENSSYFLTIKDFLKQQYESELYLNIQNLIQSQKLFENFDVKCILYQYESGTSENITLSQRGQTPSLLIRHGFSSFTEKLDELRWRHDQYRLLKLDCDEIIVWGDYDYNYYKKFLSDMPIKKIGSPRHDEFFKDTNKKNKSKKTILITAPPVIEWTGKQTINLELRYENVLQSIIKELQNDKNIKIIAKLHPGWGWKFNYTLMKIFQNIDPEIPVFSTKSIIELIDDCDIIVNINPEQNQPSTVILEGLIMKKPVINVELDELNNELDYDGVSPIISLSYKSNIQKYVLQLLNDRSFYENHNKKIENFLGQYLLNHANASGALAKYLKSFI